MGSAMNRMWDKGHECNEHLRCLTRWSRKDLIAVCQRFRRQSVFAITCASFVNVLGWDNPSDAEGVFDALQPKKGCVDFMSVIMPMILTSDQKYISRVTFMFSIMDFNASSSVNHAEFCIGLRGLCRGIARFFPNAVAPGLKQIELLVDSIFSRIDQDSSGYIILEEIVTFAYRSTELFQFMSPFPSDQTEAHEQLLTFQKQAKEDEAAAQKSAKTTVRERLRLTPDPRGQCAEVDGTLVRKKKTRRLTTAGAMNIGLAYSMWEIFQEIRSEKDVTVRPARILALSKDAQRIDRLLAQPHESLTPTEMTLWKVQASNLGGRLHDNDFLRHINTRDRENESLSLRELCCLVWPKLPEGDIDACMRFCSTFQARRVLRDIIERSHGGQEIDIETEDIELLMRAVDVDGDGALSFEELTQQGGINSETARELIQKLDCDGSKNLSKSELLSVILHMDSSVKERLRCVVATRTRSCMT
eukprot:TRINITY_DN18234_c0_g1_i1.p1 TRINITY_DN18234_c0_g1~~TRINITY_DN18234_c0_g1_i1.p1  ORF type:complete len:474 (-),score=60.76 TRINITY_DN18234_c0_g1_i1:142-1563(-)